MILLLHIGIALGSLGFIIPLYLQPSRAKMLAMGSMIAGTLASGVYLILSTHVSMVHVCVSGLVYLAIAGAGMAAAGRKFAHQIQSIDARK